MKLMDLPQFWKKDTFSKATGVAIMGGGGFRHTWWGAGRALGTNIKHFLPKKNAISFFRCLFEYEKQAPSPPPHELIFEISKYDM